MKLTKHQLKQLIKEELQNALHEAPGPKPSMRKRWKAAQARSRWTEPLGREPTTFSARRGQPGMGEQVCGDKTCVELDAEMDDMVALIKTLGGCWPPRGSRWAPPPGEALPGEECP
jgi:hypothetical protein